MSQSRYWSVIPETKTLSSQSLTLRNALLPFDGQSRRILTCSDVRYLEGMDDGGCEGASELLELIAKHDQIEITRQ